MPTKTSTTPDERLREIRERLAQATPGPWKSMGGGEIVQLTDAGKGYPLDYYPDSKDVATSGSGFDGERLGVHREEDASLIANAPSDLRWLLDRCAALAAERDALTVALRKIDAIRNSIVGTQSINWSAHIYPLVAALQEAGFEGLGYEKAREAIAADIAELALLLKLEARLREFAPLRGLPGLDEIMAQLDTARAHPGGEEKS